VEQLDRLVRTAGDGERPERQIEVAPLDELEELAPIEVTLPAEGRSQGDFVPIRLEAQVTAVGTLQLDARPLTPLTPDERWKVELSVRRAAP